MTTLYGLLGYPVHHSVSPQMMGAAFGHTGVSGSYIAFPVHVECLEDAVRGLWALGAGGANVTIPHKERVFHLLDDISESAKLVGAVNTLVRGQGAHFVGHNTDVDGWWKSVEAYVQDRSPSTVAIIGAGGAARAVLAALALYRPDVRVHVVARRQEQAEALMAAFRSRIAVQTCDWDSRHHVIANTDLVVQTTPIGMWPNSDASIMEDETCLFPGQLVVDIVYRPLKTALLQAAERRGATPVDGLSMLVHQGARAFELWTGQAAPIEVMREAALAALG